MSAVAKIGTHVEQVVTGHARLSRNTGRDNDNLGTLKGLLKVLLSVTRAGAGRVDVSDISSHTRGKTDVVQAEVCHILVQLEKQRELKVLAQDS